MPSIRRLSSASGLTSLGLDSPYQARNAKGLRDWLRSEEEQAASDHPEFAPLLDVGVLVKKSRTPPRADRESP